MPTTSWRISCISFLILVLELSLIRLIPAEIKAISYFTNLLLFSSFFGLGLGCILGSRRPLDWLLPLGSSLLFGFLFLSRGIVVYNSVDEGVHYWLQNSDQSAHPFLRTPLFVAALAVFVLAAIPFVPLGQYLVRAMDTQARLKAYGWDIAGSLAGTLVFIVSAYFGTPPWVWAALVPGFFAAVFVRGRLRQLLFSLSGAAFLLLAGASYAWKWSPYYFVRYQVAANTVTVWVNSSFHQEAINFSSDDARYRPVADMMREKFGSPYALYRQTHGDQGPKNVLILGAGSGNDVNIALLNGAESVTAVEIDPVILSLGRDYNPGHPYQNPKVNVVVDDGRHFLHNTTRRYDLIIFGTLDSQTLLSEQANLRLENYIYTVECFRDVRAALGDRGMVAAYYSVFKPWFYGRIYSTMDQAFPGELKLYRFGNNYLFNTLIVGGKNVPGFTADPATRERLTQSIPSTDDWPYIYMERPMIAPLYRWVIGMMVALIAGTFVCLRIERACHCDHPAAFFLLGMGFTLMEAAAIVRLALLFGTKWMVSALVFSTALLTIALSNWLVMRRPRLPRQLAWTGLLGTLALNYLLPADRLLCLSEPLRLLAAILLIGLPIFCSGVCFSTLFARQRSTGYALGINLVGAMCGGLVEYASMLVGMRDVWLIIILVYVAALLFSLRAGASGVPAAESPATP